MPCVSLGRPGPGFILCRFFLAAIWPLFCSNPINSYIVTSMDREVPLPLVYTGGSLFLPCFMICIFLLLLWPDLVMWLPGVLQGG